MVKVSALPSIAVVLLSRSVIVAAKTLLADHAISVAFLRGRLGLRERPLGIGQVGLLLGDLLFEPGDLDERPLPLRLLASLGELRLPLAHSDRRVVGRGLRPGRPDLRHQRTPTRALAVGAKTVRSSPLSRVVTTAMTGRPWWRKTLSPLM